ncbi:hypothetical protein KSP40_PGU000481 [Platanthera guangdongensis]|uniref:GAG-pre-integrase domain-containing protein n=1 Tax=Platanthera guangdongensis TaxID=2320717 RepID=A0ABR2MI18_9ASPA
MKASDSAAIWHERLGHVGMDKLKAMAEIRHVKGLPRLSSYGDGQGCAGCQHGEAYRLLKVANTQQQTDRILNN